MWQAFIFFLCPTPELAEQAVLFNDTVMLPAECSWTDEKVGTIDTIVSDYEVDGVTIQIGSVRMATGRRGYSAGRAPEIY